MVKKRGVLKEHVQMTELSGTSSHQEAQHRLEANAHFHAVLSEPN